MAEGDPPVFSNPPINPYANPYMNPYGAEPVNQERADALIRQHKESIAQREGQMQGIQGQQDKVVADMSKLLDQTAAKIRAARTGNVSLPLLALGSGMMGPGNFGDQVGRGLQAMTGVIGRQREGEIGDEEKIAGLEMQKAKLQMMPLEDRLKYIQALQTGDIAAQRAIEAASLRTGATQANQAEKQAADRQKLAQKTIAAAAEAARKEYADLAKENEYTAEEQQKIWKELFNKHLTMQAGGAGIQLNEGEINKALQMTSPTGLGDPKSGFPKFDQMQAQGEQQNLPVGPNIYEGQGSKQRAQTAATERTQYNKEQAKWDASSLEDQANLDLVQQAKAIIMRNPDIMGMIAGRGWDFSNDAQELKRILKKMEITQVPKGQGQITDFERKLFSEAGVLMTQNPEVAISVLNQLGSTLQRSGDHRAFMDKYFNTYRTLQGAQAAWERYMRSPHAGYAIEDPQTHRLTANKDRMPPEVYFKLERMGNPPARIGPDGRWYILKDGQPVPVL